MSNEDKADATIQRRKPTPEGCRKIWLVGGRFWGTQEYLSGIGGIVHISVGYANGNTPFPTYEAVCSHATGCAEAVHTVYDPKLISLSFLLELYFQSVNPTSVNRQGGDVGDQYRTGVYYLNSGDLPVIRSEIDKLARSLTKPVAIEVKPLRNYYLAEEYHQDYLRKNPGGYCHISPALISFAGTAREYKSPDDDRLKESLTPLQYEVMQHGATEPPFQNEYNDHFERGIYVDVTTGQPLFLSGDKFESGCGWPSFSRPIHPRDLLELTDTSHGMLRTEVRSRIGNAHLGHVFEDGPRETGGLRYCINSAALKFIPQNRMETEGYGHLLPLLGEH